MRLCFCFRKAPDYIFSVSTCTVRAAQQHPWLALCHGAEQQRQGACTATRPKVLAAARRAPGAAAPKELKTGLLGSGDVRMFWPKLSQFGPSIIPALV